MTTISCQWCKDDTPATGIAYFVSENDELISRNLCSECAARAQRMNNCKLVVSLNEWTPTTPADAYLAAGMKRAARKAGHTRGRLARFLFGAKQ